MYGCMEVVKVVQVEEDEVGIEDLVLVAVEKLE
jgi:hypothetical protein